MSFFENINFSSSNEDGATELAALYGQGQGGQKREINKMLCLTGSGSRSLDMLLCAPKQIISLDINPKQNELLRLKMSAFRTLDYQEMLAYIGVTNSSERLALHKKVTQDLSKTSRDFWDKNLKSIEKGLWYSGLWERVLRFGAKGNRLIRGKNIDLLFAASTLEEQHDIWTTKFDDFIWRSAIKLLGRPWVWTHIIGEPGGHFLPDPKEVEKRLAHAFSHASKTFFFRDSDFASLILRGTHMPPKALPLHMQEEQFDPVRNQLDKIKIVLGGLTDLKRLDIENVDAFSLSDFGSYCDQTAYDACWSGICAAAAPEAWFCERIFMNTLTADNQLAMVVNAPLSEKLTRQDKAFIYTIRAGTLKGSQNGMQNQQLGTN